MKSVKEKITRNYLISILAIIYVLLFSVQSFAAGDRLLKAKGKYTSVSVSCPPNGSRLFDTWTYVVSLGGSPAARKGKISFSISWHGYAPASFGNKVDYDFNLNNYGTYQNKFTYTLPRSTSIVWYEMKVSVSSTDANGKNRETYSKKIKYARGVNYTSAGMGEQKRVVVGTESNQDKGSSITSNNAILTRIKKVGNTVSYKGEIVIDGIYFKYVTSEDNYSPDSRICFFSNDKNTQKLFPTPKKSEMKYPEFYDDKMKNRSKLCFSNQKEASRLLEMPSKFPRANKCYQGTGKFVISDYKLFVGHVEDGDDTAKLIKVISKTKTKAVELGKELRSY